MRSGDSLRYRLRALGHRLFGHTGCYCSRLGCDTAKEKGVLLLSGKGMP